MLQPLDQGIILQVKTLARKALLFFIIEKAPDFANVDDCVKKITVYHAIRLLSADWSVVTSDTIQRCFSCTGINSLASDEWNTNPIVKHVDFEKICLQLPPAFRGPLCKLQKLINHEMRSIV